MDAQPDRALLFGIEPTQLTGEARARGNLLHELLATTRFGGLLRGHTAAVTSVAFSPKGRTLASASGDSTIRLWDVTTYQLLGAPLTGHTGAVLSVVFNPDGQTLASASFDQTIRPWDVTTGQPLGDPRPYLLGGERGVQPGRCHSGLSQW